MNPLQYIPEYQNTQLLTNNFQQQAFLKRKTHVVPINSKFRDKKLYPNANNFKISLGKTYNNVEKIELVSTVFPNCDHVIKGPENGSLQNNVIRWCNNDELKQSIFHNVQFLYNIPGKYYTFQLINYLPPNTNYLEGWIFNTTNECIGKRTFYYVESKLNTSLQTVTTYKFYYNNVGNFTCSLNMPQVEYSISIPSGNYTINTLILNIQTKMNNVRKLNGEYHFFAVDFNNSTDILTFSQFNLKLLPDNPISTTAGSYIVIINMPNHGFKTGDTTLLTGVSDVGGIPADLLNLQYPVTPIDFQTFSILVPTKATSTATGGGTNCKLGEPTKFKFLFNKYDRYYNDTKGFISRNLGFLQENSSVSLIDNNPISTVTFTVTNFLIHPSYTELTLDAPISGLFKPCYVGTITNYSVDIITVSTPHKITTEMLIFIDTIGYVTIRPVSTLQLQILNKIITQNLIGLKVYYGDTIVLNNMVVQQKENPFFFIESIIQPNILRIKSVLNNYYIKNVGQPLKIYTEMLKIKHPKHQFNAIDADLNSNDFYQIVNQTGSFAWNVPFDTTTHIVISNALPITIVDGLLTFTETASGTFNPSITTLNVGDFAFLTFKNWRNPNQPQGFNGDNILCKVLSIDNSGYKTWVAQLNNNATITYQTNTTTVRYNPKNSSVFVTGTVVDNTYTNYTISQNSSSMSINIPNAANTPELNYALLNTKENEVQIYNLIDPSNTIFIEDLINRSFPIRLNQDPDSYYIITRRQYYPFENNIQFGGNNVRISSDLHGYSEKRSNTITWSPEDKLNSSITLQGENYVYLLTSLQTAGLNTFKSVGGEIFGQILLTVPPGYFCFDTFITEPVVFDNLLNKISDTTFQVVYDTGDYYDFKNLDYSFTLKITTVEKVIPGQATRNAIQTHELN